MSQVEPTHPACFRIRRLSRKSFRTLPIALAALLLSGSPAAALSVDLLRPAGPIDLGGLTIQTTHDASFDIVYRSTGESLGCNGDLLECLGDARGPGTKKAVWTRTTTISFEGPVALNAVSLDKLFNGSVATIHTTDGRAITLDGTGIAGLSSGLVTADLGGAVVESIAITSSGFMGQATLAVLDFDVLEPGADTAPSNPIPEPHAALLFAVGLLAAGACRRR